MLAGSVTYLVYRYEPSMYEVTHSEAPGLVVSPSMVHLRSLELISRSVVGLNFSIERRHWWYFVAGEELSSLLFSTTSWEFVYGVVSYIRLLLRIVHHPTLSSPAGLEAGALLPDR